MRGGPKKNGLKAKSSTKEARPAMDSILHRKGEVILLMRKRKVGKSRETRG